MHVHARACVNAYACIFIFEGVGMCIRVCICMCTCVYVRVHMCINACVCECNDLGLCPGWNRNDNGRCSSRVSAILGKRMYGFRLTTTSPTNV